MNKVKGLWFFLIAVLILGMAWLSIFGISYWYGDIRFSPVRGITQISGDFNLKSSGIIVFKPVSEAEITDEELDEYADKLNNRLSSGGYGENAAYPDYVNKAVVAEVLLPFGANKYSIDGFVSNVVKLNQFTAMEGTDALSEETADLLILTSEDIKNAVLNQEGDAENLIMFIEINLTTEGASKWAEATQRLAKDKGDVSFWIDNGGLLVMDIQKAETEGVIKINSDQASFDVFSSIVGTINLGALPFSADAEATIIAQPDSGENVFVWILASLGAAAVTAVICYLFMYGFNGVASVFGVLSVISAVAVIFSGFSDRFGQTVIGVGGIFGALVLLLGFLLLHGLTAEAVKTQFSEKTSLENSLRQGYRSYNATGFDMAFLTLILAFIIVCMFGTGIGFYAFVIYPVIGLLGGIPVPGIYSLGVAGIFGGIFIWVSWCLARIMTMSAARFNFLKKAGLFGGRETKVK